VTKKKKTPEVAEDASTHEEPLTLAHALDELFEAMSESAKEHVEPQLLYVLNGVRYESLWELERRGTGEVLMLAQRRLEHGPSGHVTVRTLRPASGSLLLSRMVDEVNLAFLLHHPAIAQVHHFTLHRGTPHVIMEHVDGPTLDRVLNLMAMRNRPVTPAFALHVAAEVADALHHAHTLEDSEGRPLGIVHRDVSPRNISLDKGGAVKLTHFGAAYSLMVGREESPELLLKGDVAYASPEYLRLEPLEPASDVFSLGLVLVELLTGHHLYSGDESAEVRALFQRPGAPGPHPEESPSLPFVLLRQLSARLEPRHVEQALAGLPVPLQALLHRALHPEPSARYATAAELRDALRSVLAQGPQPYGRQEISEELARLTADARALHALVDHAQGAPA
jgi:serine/threonine-protein kinase